MLSLSRTCRLFNTLKTSSFRQLSRPSSFSIHFSTPVQSFTASAFRLQTPNAPTNSTQQSTTAKALDFSSGGTSDMDLKLEAFDILPELKNTLTRRFNITQLYPIQAEVFTPCRSGRDIVGRSRTGTGKTLAFVLPLVERILRNNQSPRPSHCHVLILEPTRELANQVNNEIQKLVGNQVSTCVVYGGVPYHQQEQSLRRGVDIVIATPGRLIDHIEKNNIRLNNVMTCVLDEADEMLRMGFVEPVEEIMKDMPPTKQLLLFSATLPSWVSNIIRKHSKNALVIDKVTGTESQTALTVSHKAICAPRDLKTRSQIIVQLIHQYANPKARIMVFTRTKSDADQFALYISESSVRARAIHGDVPQSRREVIMSDFRSSRFQVLVATDVAARGIDIPDVELVVQSWFPEELENYVHRSGRTGRAGKSGTSVVIYEPSERGKVVELSNHLQVAVEAIYPPQHSHANKEKIMERMQGIMSKTKTTKLMNELADEMIAKYGSKAFAAALANIFGAETSTRSILTSAEGFTTVLVKKTTSGPFDPASRLISLLSLDPSFDPASIEYFRDGAVCDIPTQIADKLVEVLENDDTVQDVSIATQLPTELFTQGQGGRRGGGGGGGYGGGFRSSQGSRSRSSSMSGGGSGGYRNDNNNRGGGGYGRNDNRSSNNASYGSRGGFDRGNNSNSRGGGGGGYQYGQGGNRGQRTSRDTLDMFDD